MVDFKTIKQEIENLQHSKQRLETQRTKAAALKEASLKTLKVEYSINEDEIDSKLQSMELELQTLGEKITKNIATIKAHIQKVEGKIGASSI